MAVIKPLTVKRLIQKLRKLPPNAIVSIEAVQETTIRTSICARYIDARRTLRYVTIK